MGFPMDQGRRLVDGLPIQAIRGGGRSALAVV